MVWDRLRGRGSALRQWLERVMRVRRGEWPGLLGGFAYFFCLLCSYYILRPVRDEMGVRAGVGEMQWLFTATFVAMLAAVPVFAALASRFSRTRLIPAVYGLFIACILGFWLWLRADVAMVWGARAFFVWLSVFNLFVVSVFWSFMADLFDDTAAARLFGAISAGGSLGAIVGPGLTGVLAQGLAPSQLLPIAAGVLALTLPCMFALNRWSARRRDGGRRASGEDTALGGTLFEGVVAVARSRYMIGICVFMWLYGTMGTFAYFAQAEIVEAAFADSGDRTSMFAVIDFATNALTIGIQLFVVAHVIARFGLPSTLALVPLITAAGFVALAAAPVLAILASFQVLRRAGGYGIAKPGREMLFTSVDRQAKYKAKNFIDTVVRRGGEAVAGWVYKGLSVAGLGIPGIALTAIPLALLWAYVGHRLGATHNESARAGREEASDDEATAT
jgi:AAA family ATP:ADP antiporter